MRIIIQKNYDEMSNWVSMYIKEKIKMKQDENSNYVLGLPTGSTPLGVYRNFVNYYEAGELSFENVTTFNMDEYVNLPRSHNQSYDYFMHENLFNHVDISKSRINLLNGMAEDLTEECKSYEERIKESGGIDLFLGGIGADGHIAFNEPGSSLTSRTRIKTLCSETISDNSRFFDNINEVPTTALTVGVGTVMDAREIVIMISGGKKALALYKCIEEGVNHMWTVSALQTHPKVTIVCDEAATAELKVKTVKYFKDLQHTTDMMGNPIYNCLDKEIKFNDKVMIFSPHPDDDVIGIGGIMQMLPNKNNVKIVYMTSGLGGLPEGSDKNIRALEAELAVKVLGYKRENIIFENLPFYRDKVDVSKLDEKVINMIVENFKPQHVFVCGDNDPNGTHKKCFDILQQSLKTIENYWIYKGAWGVWNNENKNSLRRIHLTEHIFNLKKMSIQAHQSQDPPVVTSNDTRSFLQRVIDNNKSLLIPGKYEECVLQLQQGEFENYKF